MAQQKVTPFLMFVGQAEEALQFYVSLFPGSEVESMERFENGTVRTAVFVLAGQRVMCFDSPVKHDFTFTASFSFWVNCEDEADFDRLYGALGAQVFMEPANYGFSRKFAWVADRFGVAWQLNLP